MERTRMRRNLLLGLLTIGMGWGLFPVSSFAQTIAYNFDFPLCNTEVRALTLIGFTFAPDGTSGRYVTCETTEGFLCLDPSSPPPPGRIGLSLTEAGPFTSHVFSDFVVGNCVPYQTNCFQHTVYVKGLVDGKTFFQSCPNQPLSGAGCLAAGPGIYQVFTVQSMTLAERNSPLDDNPAVGGGKRIYPGKTTPDDTTDTNRVNVTAVINATLPDPLANPDRRVPASVMFRAFDMDDPTTDDGPVDANGNQGDDNRGTPPKGNFPLGADIEIQDNSGNVETEFEVSMNPGDNFKVVAGCDADYLDGVQAQGLDLIDADGANIETTQRAKGSDLLTVWRKLHLEVDEMGIVSGNQVTGTIQEVKSVTGNQAILVLADLSPEEEDAVHDADRFEDGLVTIDGLSYTVLENGSNKKHKETVTIRVPILPLPVVTGRPFVLVDDDDHNLNNGPTLIGDEGEKVVPDSATFSFMQESDDPTSNVFAPAFIMPTYDGGGSLSNDEILTPFGLNLASSNDVIDQSTLIPFSRQAVGADDFWVGYFLIGYQGPTKLDFDPADITLMKEGLQLGVTGVIGNTANKMKKGVPQGGVVSLVFQETGKESVNSSPPTPVNVRNSTSAHEMGHQFGLGGDDSKGKLGIMSSGALGFERPSYDFINEHLNLLRSRLKSPGVK